MQLSLETPSSCVLTEAMERRQLSSCAKSLTAYEKKEAAKESGKR